ncbi:hypothetical protein WL58_17990 [Burkholderia cepacia]|uniref:hypothetical protein n=1 Tax=Burkholderia cepacia TaxID=292 RepID=UPI00075A752D|nr:hypothetical protein [Burkholderia cepacia]KWC82762.1 hypothetical protein WL58_17990 [Burkholderia cepacia]
MAYVLTQRAAFTNKVVIREPGDGPDGAFIESTFVARFKWLSEDEIAGLMGQSKPIREALRDLILGWYDLNDESGQSVPFSDDVLTQLLARGAVTIALWESFLEGQSGALRKN